jgi:hypothetical protein
MMMEVMPSTECVMVAHAVHDHSGDEINAKDLLIELR